MPFTVTMPKLSPTMDEGTVVKWHKKIGDFVEAGETLLEIATDKATVEHAALDDGYLRQILVEETAAAIVNQPIAIFTESADESIEGYVPEGEMPAETPPEEAPEVEKPEPSAPAAPAAGFSEPQFTPAPPLEDYSFPALPPPSARIKASPLAAKLAEERHLDLSTVKGTGPGGRIMERDLAKAQSRSLVAFDRREQPRQRAGAYTEQTLTPMRKTIGRRLQESKTFIPHFYVTQEVDAENLVKTRTQLQAYGLKPSYNDFILRASALALREHPQVNSGYNSATQSIIDFQTIDISVAIGLEDGLITPIVRYADYKSIGEISLEVRDFARRARANKLKPEEYTGGSFCISNLGMFDISEFVAVINPPQAAILAIGGIRDQPVIRNDRVLPGKVLKLTLSSDHRVIDGLAAAKFLSTLKTYLENPAGLLV